MTLNFFRPGWEITVALQKFVPFFWLNGDLCCRVACREQIYIFLMWSCAELQASGTETTVSMTSSDENPGDQSASEHRSWRLPWCFALISHQVSYSEGFTQACILPLLWVLYKNNRSDWRGHSSDRQQRQFLFVFAIRARSWPCDGIVMRGGWVFHLSLVAWLAANGPWMGWHNPPSLQSAITYETTTVSHPVSHLPWSHTSQQPNHSWEINERRWGVMGDSLITPVHAIL